MDVKFKIGDIVRRKHEDLEDGDNEGIIIGISPSPSVGDILTRFMFNINFDWINYLGNSSK